MRGSGTIADRVFACEECKLDTRQKVFYDTAQDKERIKVMFLFESPGGEVDSDEKKFELDNLSSSQQTLYHRNGFETWPSKYYLYFKELCTNLHKFGYIDKIPKRLGTDIMDEIYVTDAVKCRGNKKEIQKYRNLKDYSCSQICSLNFLKEEIESLPNLQLIISFGNWANDALNALHKIEKKIIKQGPAVRTRKKEEFDLSFYQQFCNNTIKEHGKIYDFDYKNPSGKTKAVKNIHLYHPTWFYKRGCLKSQNKTHIREKLLIESIEWCFENL